MRVCSISSHYFTFYSYTRADDICKNPIKNLNLKSFFFLSCINPVGQYKGKKNNLYLC